MQLDYFWIGIFRNIKEQEFNLGGQYIYKTDKNPDQSYSVSRIKNPQFIDGFFKPNNVGFTNITAIVGENGSGKSNTLDFIRGIVTNRFIANHFGRRLVLANFVAVFSDANKKTYVLSLLDGIRFNYTFRYSKIDEMPEDTLTIYYSPAYDFREFTADDIDISSNYLLRDDHEKQRFANDNISQADNHRYANSSRQIEFVNSISIESDIRKRINIPDLIDVVVQFTNTEIGRQGFWNTPMNFRIYFEILDKKHRDEINELASKEYNLKNQKKYSSALIVQKEMFTSWALYYLLRNIFGNIERSNHFLQEGRVNLNDEDLLELSFKDALIQFINSQNLFPKNSILDLINELATFKDHILEYDDGPQDIKVARVDFKHILFLQKKYLAYENSMFRIAGNSIPYGYMEFNWHGLSTGEKAYLDLFSRLFYAKKKIYERVRKLNAAPSIPKFPSNIILLLDEGELGFHLQWQKEYLRNLIELTPLLYQTEKPNIQLIFTTHSPISLSDVPHSNIVYLKKENGNAIVLHAKGKPKHSFGANIHDLIQDAFYLKNGYTGDFAENKIQKAIDWCNDQKNKRGAETIKKLISLIDEPILKVKLAEMYAAKMGGDEEIARLEIQRDYIIKRINELKQYDQD